MTTIRAVWPELPTVKEWAPYLTPAYQRNWHTNTGPVSLQLEDRLHDMFGFEGEAVTLVNNATSGLTACLVAHRISGPVICPGFTFKATPCAILGANCEPVVVDVDPDTGTVPPDTLTAALAETGAKAAMLVCPYGIETDFSRHAEVCRQAGAILIIDNAAGLGVVRRSTAQSAWEFGVYEVFSLHATKVFGIGEGGAVFSAANRQTDLRSSINFGLNTQADAGNDGRPFWGINAKMSEAAAAIGLAVADRFQERVKHRQDMAKRWVAALQGSKAQIFCPDASRAPWQVFPICLRDEDTTTLFVDRMAEQGIEIRRYYNPSMSDCAGMTCFGPCPVSHDLSSRVAVLPVRSWMPLEEQEALMTTTVSVLNDIHG